RSALRDYLLGGGRVIADGNFMNYYGRGDPTLGPVLPASWCGSGSPRSASLAFTQVAPTDPIVHNGMPASFTFSPDGSYLGVCLSPTAGARTFYLADTFQNGKPTVSLVGRVLAGGGRSIGYSTLIGLISLQSADFKRLFVNVVEWAASGTTTSPGLLAARPATLSFNYQIGGIAPAAQSISVTSSGAAVSFGAAASASDGGWLSISPASGTTPGALNVSVNPSGWAPGAYNGAVNITAPGGAPKTVAVTLTIASGVKVYILRGGDTAADTAVAQAVQDRGHSPSLGVATESFDGTQVRLADFDAVVILDNTD